MVNLIKAHLPESVGQSWLLQIGSRVVTWYLKERQVVQTNCIEASEQAFTWVVGRRSAESMAQREAEYGVSEEREVIRTEWSITQVKRGDNEVRSQNKAQSSKIFEDHGKKFGFCPRENREPLKCSYTPSFTSLTYIRGPSRKNPATIGCIFHIMWLVTLWTALIYIISFKYSFQVTGRIHLRIAKTFSFMGVSFPVSIQLLGPYSSQAVKQS